MNWNFVIRSRRVITPEGVRPAAMQVRRGKIAAVTRYGDCPAGWRRVDFGNSVVMPGLVDTHVHINEPGRTHWEGFRTATRTAAAGGVTTLIEMPLNSIPATTSVAAFHKKLAAAPGKCWVDVGFWGGVVPGNTHELRRLLQAGVFGFKCFLVPSGVNEFRQVAEPDLRKALRVLAKLGAILLVHSELRGPIDEAAKALASEDPRRHRTWLLSRPPGAEEKAIALLVRLSRKFGARVHIVHLSAASAIPILRRAKQAGLPITVETCPHYLFFTSRKIPNGDTRFKCAPPIRNEKNRRALWTALRKNVIDLVVSDHSPCPPAMKLPESGDFLRAWGGIASLQLGLPIVWTAARARGFSLVDLARWMCAGPARLAGLAHRKGAIAPGYDADLVVWNPEARFEVKRTMLHDRHKNTPYLDHRLAGVVEATFLHGRQVYERGKIVRRPSGAILKRGHV